MSQIKINYAEVHAKVAQMRNQMSMQLHQMEGEYKQIESCLLSRTDGAATTAICSVANINKQKAYEVAETFDKLLTAMTNAARQVEVEELKIANVFNSSGLQNNNVG